MSINAPRPVKLGEVKEANMVRKTKKQAGVAEDVSTNPQFGAGSVYNAEQKEETKMKKRGYQTKTVNREDLPYALRLGGKGGRRYTGRKEATMLDHSAYFIFTQCPDGVFEAIPVQGWYNFIPDVNYSTLSADEVEMEFSRRSKSINFISNKYKLKEHNEDDEKKAKVQDHEGSLIIHDDADDAYNQDDNFDDSDSEDKKKESSGGAKKEKAKNLFHGKKKKGNKSGSEAEDSDEEEEFDLVESKEVDYMSESSSEDEEKLLDDEPEPEKGNDGRQHAKDDLNTFQDTSDEEEDENELNDAGKELRALIKKENFEDGGSDDDEMDDDDDDDEDIDEEKYSKSALFMQGGKKKHSGSKPSSRSNTPLSHLEASETLSAAAAKLEGNGSKIGAKRPNSRLGQSDSPTPGGQAKKFKSDSPTNTPDKKRQSPSSRSATPSQSNEGIVSITEEAIRKVLMHKPITTTDLVRKFNTKKTGLTKEQTLSAIAAVLKRIAPSQEKIDGKLYLSIKSKK